MGCGLEKDAVGGEMEKVSKKKEVKRNKFKAKSGKNGIKNNQEDSSQLAENVIFRTAHCACAAAILDSDKLP